jgi:FAD/FMN-containing dehydrogenase
VTGAVPSECHLAWGRVHRFRHVVVRPAHRAAAVAALVAGRDRRWLAYGCGRSYGDSCLNDGEGLIETGALDRFLAFDRTRGILTCEAGVTLAAILAHLARPEADGSAWFLPVTPGTRFVTVGGAIANDVHGKNHHHAGTFGRHVLSFDLVRSDGSVVTCTPGRNAALFRATIGGLGLTGLIVSATLQLARVPGLMVELEDIGFDRLEEFYRLAAESEAGYAHTVAWVDCLASRGRIGRGIFSRANHVAAPDGAGGSTPLGAPRRRQLRVPFAPPFSPLNRWTLGAFNALYRRAKLGGRHAVRRHLPYAPVFYPLDAIDGWNRMYGARGFFQYQCVIPAAAAPAAVAELLRVIAAAGTGSFLAVLKTFGSLPSPGMLSFPCAGTTLALDFPNRGAPTRALLERLDAITTAAGGRIYPAKDGRVTAARFQAYYPAWRAFAEHVDPGFSSSFWRRVSGPA